MRQVPIEDAAGNLLRLVEELGASGDTIVLTHAGRPVAELTRPRMTRDEAFALIESIASRMPPSTREENDAVLQEGRKR